MWKEDTTTTGAGIYQPNGRPRSPGFLGKILSINYAAIEPAKRGFSLERPAGAERVREIGSAFLDGYHCALAGREIAPLCEQLNQIRNEVRGFAYEGAAMGVAILDFMRPWRRNRFREFLRSPDGDRHLYMLYVGLGWAYARLPVSPERVARRGDSLEAWLVLDGHGFHEGFFNHRKYLGSSRRPKRLSEYGRRVFDQGLGRSLWFVLGGDAQRIADTIGALAASRHADLWSGAGLGCAYAGGCGRENIERLAGLGGEFSAELAQGASFAAKARLRGGNLGEHTEMACEILCGSPAAEAAAVTDEVLAAVDRSNGGGSYESWREGIKKYYKQQKKGLVHGQSHTI